MLFSLSLPVHRFIQLREEENKEYVFIQFHALLGEFPKLAWILPDGTVAAESNSPEVLVYSGLPTIEVAKLRQKLAPDETLKFVDKHRIACDAHLAQNPPAFSLYSSALKVLAEYNPQVLFTSKALKGMKAGFQRGSLDDRLAAEVWKRMMPESPRQLRSSLVIRQPAASFFYSFAALYQDSNQEVSRFGIFLHSEGGQIIASEVTGIDAWCDGCAVPTFKDGIDPIFRVVNLFTFPGLEYPLLMLDTSTVEGRSLTLATFSPEGKYSSHLFYEYTVNCSQ